ncbi:hypothetical protein LCGC14_2398420 [marine sediment metagenome]|uniref:Uncharacterized protein n=1 Tax=marine sediment metagenome TaxID=412755 RepID=A0A0F9BW46_9ZZZZ
MSDVAKMLANAVEKGDGTMAVGVALKMAPNALLGIGLQTGLEFALQYPTAAAKFLEQARESEDAMAKQIGFPSTDKPKVCSRIATALFSIVEGAE